MRILGASRGSLRTASAHIDFSNDTGEYQVTHMREIGGFCERSWVWISSTDTSYSDPVGPQKERPKTGAGGKKKEEDFQFDELDDSLLPE